MLGVSYPTVRARFEQLLRALGYEAAPEPEPGESRADVLGAPRARRDHGRGGDAGAAGAAAAERRSVESTSRTRCLRPAYTVARARPLRHPRRRPRRGRRHRSRARTANWRCATTPIATTATVRPRSASRPSTRRTPCCPIRRSAPASIATATPTRRPRSAATSSTSSRRSSVAVWAGGAARASAACPGEDLEVEIEVTLDQARDGSTMQVEVERFTACDHCHGDRSRTGWRGEAAAATPAPAPARCGRRPSPSSVPSSPPRSCPSCRGMGEVIVDPLLGVPRRRPPPRDVDGRRPAPQGDRRRLPPAHPARGQRRRRRRPDRRPLRLHGTGAARAPDSARATTCAASCARRLRAGRVRQRSRCPRSTGRAARGRARHALRHRGAAARQGHAAAAPGGHRRPGRAHRRRHPAAAHGQGARAARPPTPRRWARRSSRARRCSSASRACSGCGRKPREDEQESAPRN
jgi:hypothetical protein